MAKGTLSWKKATKDNATSTTKWIDCNYLIIISFSFSLPPPNLSRQSISQTSITLLLWFENKDPTTTTVIQNRICVVWCRSRNTYFHFLWVSSRLCGRYNPKNVSGSFADRQTVVGGCWKHSLLVATRRTYRHYNQTLRSWLKCRRVSWDKGGNGAWLGGWVG